MRILLVEDDPVLREVMRLSLRDAGHRVDEAATLEQASHFWRVQPFDVVLLDLNLPLNDTPDSPLANGLTLLREARARGDRTPVLVLTARNRTDERIAGLDAGADDYLGKPFDFAELLVRLEHLSRRHGQVVAAPGDLLTVGDLVMDVAQRRVTRQGVPIELTDKEFRLLHILMSNPGQTVTRTMLLEKAWGYGFNPPTNLVEVHVFKLRSKIDKDFDPPLLRTVRAIGYALG